ncbi:MAG: hypothetical protein L0228_13965 [Planctomycetes bacterium]|nr:hypothetical protein [Planctomycetota bacterium]
MWLAATLDARAGGGPENVLLVVNSNSDSSKAIANHYIEWRKIPAQNVVYLNWRGGLRATKGETFRSRILMPAITELEGRKLNAQIDYLIYSSDFPWRIDLQNLFTAEKLPGGLDTTGSLTGTTYLAPYVVSRNPAIVMTNVNWYVPGPADANLIACQQLANVPSRGFRSVYLWDDKGSRTVDTKTGQRYLLSTMLGVTYGRGNTVEEILSYLKRAVAADGKRPRGSIYFMANNNIRSKTRDACFGGVASEINKLGVRAVVERGTIPRGKPDVMGLMAGTRSFDWAKSGSTILPGAICEHLTSFGGDLEPTAFQTPLSEFLRGGAAGSSGTVKEPGAVQAKFPLPSIQLHYVRGSSLAEAFYQSVAGPYQLLIVGDPLCQPWARIPKVTVEGIKANQELKGSVSLTPAGAGTGRLRFIDLYVDGKLTARLPPGKKIDLDTTKLADGYHEIRLVSVDSGPLETQGRIIVPVTVNNRNTKLELTIVPPVNVALSAAIRASVRQPGATAISVRQNSREVARVKGEAGEVDIPAATLGRGPTTLQAFSEGEPRAASPPVRIQVK